MFRLPWILAIVLVTVRTETRFGSIDQEDKTKIKQVAIEPGLESNEFEISQVLRTEETEPDPEPGEVYGQMSCYSCTDCDDVLTGTPVSLCPYSDDSGKMHKCIVYVEKYNYLDKLWYVRECSTKVGSCAEIHQMHEDMKDQKPSLKQCYECEGDLCNGVSISRSFPLVFLIFSPFLLKLVMF